MQSCLEVRGRTERNNEIVKSDYNNADIANNYSERHSDALSNGDAQGKGSSNFKGHSHWRPHDYHGDFSTHNMIKYNNFDTSPESNIGGCYDINGRNGISGRKLAMSTSIFNSNYQYGRDIIGTQLKK